MSATSFVIPALPQPSIPVAGDTKSFPVRRIWCVGRNYLEHIREMGNDERAPPFFFAKHADMLVPDGATIPYPPLTKDLHHEVELIVAMKSGGLNIPADKALDHVGVLGEEERRRALVISHLPDVLEIVASDAPDAADRKLLRAAGHSDSRLGRRRNDVFIVCAHDLS